jgi:hypothetical protein
LAETNVGDDHDGLRSMGSSGSDFLEFVDAEEDDEDNEEAEDDDNEFWALTEEGAPQNLTTSLD